MKKTHTIPTQNGSIKDQNWKKAKKIIFCFYYLLQYGVKCRGIGCGCVGGGVIPLCPLPWCYGIDVKQLYIKIQQRGGVRRGKISKYSYKSKRHHFCLLWSGLNSKTNAWSFVLKKSVSIAYIEQTCYDCEKKNTQFQCNCCFILNRLEVHRFMLNINKMSVISFTFWGFCCCCCCVV